MPIKYDEAGKIKRPGKKIDYTQEMIMEYAKCIQDPVYFSKNYYYIVNPVTGAQKIKLRDYQEHMLKCYQEYRFNIVMAARQCGKTTVSAIFLLWFSIFQKDKTVAIVANKASTAKSILEEIKYAYEELPEFLKPGVLEYNVQSITFDNGCKIIARATSPDCLRGESISIILLDEFAFIARNIADAFWTANFPTISTGGRCIIVSTPNGTGNLFYEKWMESVGPNPAFNPIRVDWTQVPGRDENWRKETEKAIGRVRFAQEFGLNFAGSSVTLIDAATIMKLKKEEPLHTPDDFTKMWDTAKPGRKYAIAGDIAAGVGSDYTVLNVFDVTDYLMGTGPAVQVAIWRSNTITPAKISKYIYNSAKYWNDAYVIVEVNPGGHGDGVCKELFEEYEYENLYFDQDRHEYGFLSTKTTKPKACMKFKTLLEADKIILKDGQTIDEIGYFEEVAENVFKAKTGKGLNDDCIITCILFSYMITSTYFEGEIYDLQQKILKTEAPEQWHRNKLEEGEENPQVSSPDDDDYESAVDAFMAADQSANDPDSWLEKDEFDHFIRETERAGNLDRYMDQQRNFHRRK